MQKKKEHYDYILVDASLELKIEWNDWKIFTQISSQNMVKHYGWAEIIKTFNF